MTTLPIPTNEKLANATYTVICDGVVQGAAYLGYVISSDTKKKMAFVSETGGLGVAPLFALADDACQLLKSSEKEMSIGRTITQLSIGTEIFADIYELASSAGGVLGSSQITAFSETFANTAMIAKTIGAFPLAFSSLDEAYAQISGNTGLLGSVPNLRDKGFERTVGSLLRATEVTAAMISTGALLSGGSSGTLFATATVVTNVAKLSRQAFNSYHGV